MKVFVLTFGKRHSTVGDFAHLEAYRTEKRAEDAAFEFLCDLGYEEFEEEKPSHPHIKRQWSNNSKTVWVEELELKL